ncbi:putative Ig domain-containing protein [Paractinoplanes atraurantiacus]|uniref:Putative Ig domain-containing protein n=1 Tax=Paractinoplanes atraurantiacus TaxID=1036182 RepID=A0A285K1S7_9ACTN|nr:putative Ig domain-containing protein [Actinoplanes atraurantiacus]SNY66515.1 Putative Ig domain-containing protein [Actinoplanes atraurantiacus]
MGRDRGSDEGFTIIETVTALTLVVITLAAAGPFFIQSFQAVARQRNQQNAVQLANMAIEQVRALKGSSLLTDRSSAKVKAQFSAAPAIVQPYLAKTFPSSDPLLSATSTSGDDAAVPTETRTLLWDGVNFDRTIYVGSCDVRVSGDCVGYDPDKNPPSWLNTPDDLQFFRVVVLLAWNNKGCNAGRCQYVTSTLVARASEPTFDIYRPSPTGPDPKQTAVFYKGFDRSVQLKVEGGQLPNTWSVVDTLPAGLTLASNGVVTGATTAGLLNQDFRFKVTEAPPLQRNVTFAVNFQIVLLPTVTVGTTSSRVGDPVSVQAVGANGWGTKTFTAAGLPAGLSISDTGLITGTAATAGSYPVTVTVTDENQVTGTANFTYVVYPGLALAAVPDQTVAFGSAVNVTAVASGGYGTYTYAATGLPLGVTLNSSTGVISGVATVPGRYLPAITVTDTLGNKATQSFALTITTTTLLSFTSPNPLAPDQTSASGKQVNLKATDNGSALGLSPVITATGLPPGLTLNGASGNISGKPDTPGTYVVTLTSTNLLPPQTSVLTFVWTIT